MKTAESRLGFFENGTYYDPGGFEVTPLLSGHVPRNPGLTTAPTRMGAPAPPSTSG